jgi:hypothetical protein
MEATISGEIVRMNCTDQDARSDSTRLKRSRTINAPGLTEVSLENARVTRIIISRAIPTYPA